jgi:N-sulfoglucosamine sulfohydrolase
VSEVAPAATKLIARRAQEDAPFFLSVGFFETHREFFEPSSIRDVLYSRPPENVPDNTQTRRDMASFRASARALDQGVGTVLNALEENGLADDTLVIMTTDHGLAFPDAKCTMYDRGIGVMLLIRGPGGFERGRVFDAVVSHLDLYPTICDVAGLDHPAWLEGTSLLPLVRGDVVQVHEEIFAEVTYHAAYEPQRAVRTERYKYLRRYDTDHPGRVLANLDDSLTKDMLVGAGWGDVDPPMEALFDLWLDPAEGTNRIGDPALAGPLADLRTRLHDWMVRTEDPLLDGPVAPAEGTVVNTVDQVSPADPTTPPTNRSLTLTRRARNGSEGADRKGQLD